MNSDPLQIQGVGAASEAAHLSRRVVNQVQSQPGGINFTQALNEAQGLHFSNHAQKRLEKRDIQLSDESVSRLADAVDKVEKRGGKSSLILMDDLAFIVNVHDRVIVTALNTKEQGEGVYSQIDSVVFAPPVNGQPPKSGIDQGA